jgi:cellulase (glycosyl hydrolase family 5)
LRSRLKRSLVVTIASALLLSWLGPLTLSTPSAHAATGCPTREAHKWRGFLHTCGNRIVDSNRHVVRLNSVSVWDLSHDSGRHPRTCSHWGRPPSGSARNLGLWNFNSVLLYISWANVESRRPTMRNGHLVHHYNYKYLRAVRGVVNGFASHGVKVILAMANDRWSSAFTNLRLPNGMTVPCGSGMPSWLYRDGGLSAMVSAEKAFFRGDRHSHKLQNWFARAWRVVVHRYRHNPAVVGADVLHEAYDLLGQPYPRTSGLTARRLHLASFYERVGRAIHRANKHLVILTGDRLEWGTKHQFAITRKPRISNAAYDFEFFAKNWNSAGAKRMRFYLARSNNWHRPAWVEEFFAYLPTSRNGSIPANWSVNSRLFFSYGKNHHVGWSYAPYWRLPNHPSGLLTVLQSGF